MDYSKLSDFEINSAVHNAKLKKPYSLVFMGDDRIAWTKDDGDQIITEKVPYTKNGVHDYCNDPSEAWPIIVDNHIAIAPYPNEAFACSSRCGMASDLSTEDKNPLRAAMIVFLMMQDDK